ncbi:hypothetical protein BS78_05G156900 [Paspalum vaginatum]|nr:hypothetical protein BS78_05G156900 [Paspalum vaginatum]
MNLKKVLRLGLVDQKIKVGLLGDLPYFICFPWHMRPPWRASPTLRPWLFHVHVMWPHGMPNSHRRGGREPREPRVKDAWNVIRRIREAAVWPQRELEWQSLVHTCDYTTDYWVL